MARSRHLQVDVEVWRGSIPESRHRIQAVLVDAAGERLAATANPGLVTSFRSSAKPFQLLPFVERGYAERWKFTPEHLAIMAASHTGSPYHLALVREILDRLGLGENALACGYHDPIDPESLDAVQSQPERRSPLYNNCSGKHAGMLAHALAEGWPLAGYEKEEHPLQQRIRDTVASMCGVRPESLLIGIDGCSVCVFGAPLESMARAYAQFAAADAGGAAREAALARIRSAMIEYPLTTGGGKRFSSQLMIASGGALVAKGGAEGLECIGVPSRGLGLALKCEDGRSRGVGPAVVALLDHLRLLTDEQIAKLEPWRRPVVRNAAGQVVGEVRAQVTDVLDAVTS